MSALEKLVARYQRDLVKPEREHLRRAELEAMQIYNEICHDLAEKIRQAKCEGTSPDDELCPCGEFAANLIDPEVT